MSERGATLVEALINAAILMVLSALSMPMASTSLSSYRLRSDSHQVAAQFQNARFMAISSNVQHRLRWNGSTLEVQKLSAGNYVTVDRHTLANGLRVASSWTTDPVINPRGLVTPAVSVTLAAGGKTRTVSVSVIGLVTEQ
jgi:Tfp pilus assembly protein FimT